MYHIFLKLWLPGYGNVLSIFSVRSSDRLILILGTPCCFILVQIWTRKCSIPHSLYSRLTYTVLTFNVPINGASLHCQCCSNCKSYDLHRSSGMSSYLLSLAVSFCVYTICSEDIRCSLFLNKHNQLHSFFLWLGECDCDSRYWFCGTLSRVSTLLELGRTGLPFYLERIFPCGMEGIILWLVLWFCWTSSSRIPGSSYCSMKCNLNGNIRIKFI